MDEAVVAIISISSLNKWILVMCAANQDQQKGLFNHNSPPSGPIPASDTSSLPELHCCTENCLLLAFTQHQVLLGDPRKQDCHSECFQQGQCFFTSFAKLPDVASRKASSVIKEGHLYKKHIGFVRIHCDTCSEIVHKSKSNEHRASL